MRALRKWSIFLSPSALTGCTRLSLVKTYASTAGKGVQLKVVKAARCSRAEDSDRRTSNVSDRSALQLLGNAYSLSGGGTEIGSETENGFLKHLSTAQIVPPSSVDSGESVDEERLGASCRQHGCIHLIVGPMFAGKTTALLSRMQQEIDRGRYFSQTNCFVLLDQFLRPCEVVTWIESWLLRACFVRPHLLAC